ncbi:hypothetical protein OAC79_02995 [Amylibacter sp.]|nr:hypothetical protein [Amylibacter sp.]
MIKKKLTINGFGRIGRSVFRKAISDPRFDVVAINDLNPDTNNICYLYNYDSIHGVEAEANRLRAINSNTIQIGKNGPLVTYSKSDSIEDIDLSNTDVIVDASGLSNNGNSIKRALSNNPKIKVLATHMHPDAELYLVLGANHDAQSTNNISFVSSSICDATALAPVIRALDEKFGISKGHITTVHPWLNYQNLMDGPSTSWANPGDIYHHYPLGRSALDNLIPKPTTAVDATLQSLPGFDAQISSFSYRVPTSIVGSANLVLQLKEVPESKKEVIDAFIQFDKNLPWPIFAINDDPLISKDFVNRPESAIIDSRWIELLDNQLHLVLWYDNENGYSARVLDQSEYITSEGLN